MNMATKFDFSPEVFDEQDPAAGAGRLAEPTPAPTRPSVTRWIVIAVVILTGVIAVTILNRRPDADRPLAPFPLPELSDRSVAMPAMPAPVPRADGFCAGDGALCATTTTRRPAARLRQLAATLPPSAARQYRIWVFVAPATD